MIASDLGALESKAYAESSQKEKLFFLFLSNGDLNSVSLGDSPSERLCHDAFVLKVNESDVLKKMQRSQPIKNIHYSKNLIDLVAASKIDYDNERDHIKEYLSDHGLREAFLLHLALGVEIPEETSVKSDLDRLISSVVFSKSFDDATNLFSKLMLQTQHIFDVIVLKEIYRMYLEIHPDSKSVEDYENLRVVSKKVSHALNGLIMLILTSFVAFLAVEYINWYMENKKLHDEYQKVAIQIFSVILIVAMFLGLNVPDKVRFLDLARNKIFTFIYFLIGLKYSDVEKILKKDADKSS
ncbi:hypothetical protein QFX18_06855 [Saccharophagus degradans]|uniref:hypothetical protein n=1 Tax=Saccharophagus degradans TaxID=86304 RepID=UPI002477EE62|nr:hypothetical protein [Saccharophagus degradans]WGO99781.1 hypothetical protein QFX18_06855 [Saccharophagus degradans]